MDKKELFRAIDACEDRFIREAAEDIQKRKSSIIRRFFFVNSSENAEKDMRKLSGVRVVAAIVICVIVLSIGVQTAARVSTVFRDWIEQTFQIKSPSDNQKGKNGRSNEEETGRVRRRNNKADGETNLSIARLVKSKLNSVFKRFLPILTSVMNYCKISQNIVLFWVQIG